MMIRNHHYRHFTESPLLKMTMNISMMYKEISYQRKIQLYPHEHQLTNAQGDAVLSNIFDEGFDGVCFRFAPHHYGLIKTRYVIVTRARKGYFVSKICGHDPHDMESVTIKVIRNVEPFITQALMEIKLLEMVGSHRSAANYAVKIHNHFPWQGHLFIVMDSYPNDLYSLMKHLKFHGFPLCLTRGIAKNLVKALYIFASPDLDIIHGDLRPECISYYGGVNDRIKINDFGTSWIVGNRIHPHNQTRFYQSPELILSLPYGHAIDMWALGCVLVELHTGDVLFPGENDFDQLMKIIEVVGLPPKHLLDASSVTGKFFDKNDDGSYACHVVNNRVYQPPGSINLSDILSVEAGGPKGCVDGQCAYEPLDYQNFLNFIEKLLVFDQYERLKPSESLKHHFLASDLHATR